MVKNWCIRNNIQFIDDMDRTEETYRAGCFGNYTLETEQLGRCIENGEEPFVSPDFSIKNAEMLDVILEKIGY